MNLKRKNKLWTRLLAAMLIAVLLTTGPLTQILAYGKERALPKSDFRPQDHFLQELIAGSIGGVMFGQTLLELGIQVFYCKLSKSSEEYETCRAITLVLARTILYPTLVFVGTSAAIWGMGALSGVQGNLLGLLVGSSSGALAGTHFLAVLIRDFINYLLAPERITELQNAPETPEWIKRAYPYFSQFLKKYEQEIKEITLAFSAIVWSAVWGAIGFNIGATLADSK